MNFPAALYITKTPNKQYQKYFDIKIETSFGVIFEDNAMWTPYDFDLFVKGIRFALPFTAIKITDSTEVEEPPNEITNLRGESKEQETDDDLPF